jgi:hypothetical protein
VCLFSFLSTTPRVYLFPLFSPHPLDYFTLRAWENGMDQETTVRRAFGMGWVGRTVLEFGMAGMAWQMEARKAALAKLGRLLTISRRLPSGLDY